MVDCDICKILENKTAFKFIYEDDLCFAILHESPAIQGHVIVIPKKHVAILEELDDNVVEHLYIISNKISTAIFDTLGAHGTNIIVNNGTAAGQELPHVVINILPRKENDNINLEWQPKQVSDAELKTTQSMINSYSDNIFSGKDTLPDIKIKQEVRIDKEEENYLVKGLKRIP